MGLKASLGLVQETETTDIHWRVIQIFTFSLNLTEKGLISYMKTIPEKWVFVLKNTVIFILFTNRDLFFYFKRAQSGLSNHVYCTIVFTRHNMGFVS